MFPKHDERESAGPRVPPVSPSAAELLKGGRPSVDRNPHASATGNVPFSLGNRPALTGIRAIGVSLVLIFHSNFSTLPGSWVALALFFVLSGFLITAMLADEHQKTGRISLGRFYSRRAVRLLPPLILTVALLGIYAALVHVSDAAHRVWGDSAAALFYFSDYRQAFEHNPLYSGFLTQTWSLAIEEQYYLIWAALLLLALKASRRRIAYVLASAGIVACTVNRIHIVLGAHPYTIHTADRVYYAFDTRADALFLGCLLGLLATGGHLQNWRPWAARTLAVSAVVSTAVMAWIVLSISLGDRSLPLVWLPVSQIASAVIITYFIVLPRGLGTRAMGLPLLVVVGNMSYTIYLIHWPIFVALSPSTTGMSYWVLDPLRMAIVIPLAAASWYLMEKPLTRWRRRRLDPSRPTQPPASSPAHRPVATDDSSATLLSNG